MEKDIKKEKILKASLGLFARYGFKKTTIEDVATEAEMTPGNIYFYVKNKKELYLETIRYGLTGWRNHVAIKTFEGNDPPERFRIMAQTAFNYLKDHNELREIIMNDPDIFTLSEKEDRFRDINLEAIDLIKGILESGISAKFFRHVDIDHTSEFIFSVYIMFIIKTYVKSDKSCSDTMFDQAVNLIINGLLKPV